MTPALTPEMPLIAYQYIDGYQPQAYNLTKTLSEDPVENVFTFVYSPLPDNTVYTNTTTTVVSGTTPTAPPDETGGTTSGESSASSGTSSSETSSQPEENIGDNDVPHAQPEPPVQKKDLDKIDDNDVPTANFNGDKGKLISDGKMLWNHIPLAAKIAGGTVMLGGFSVALWLLIFRRRRKDEQ